jgi:cyclopropane-fatty-acyl-phospholipid synthase
MTGLDQAVHAPEPATWPTLEPPRSNPVRRTAAMTAIRYITRDLPAIVEMDGRRLGQGGPVMQVHRSGQFLDRLGQDAGSGFGEAYLAGDWDPAPGTDLADLLLPFAERFSSQRDNPLLPDGRNRCAGSPLAGSRTTSGTIEWARARTSAATTTSAMRCLRSSSTPR